MKKIIFTLSAICAASFSVNAQITVTAANYSNVTTGLNQKVDTLPIVGIVSGSSGANVTYDFSALHSHLTSSSTFITPALGVLGAKFPSANICMHQDTNYMYFDTSSTKLEFWGVAGNLLQISTNTAIVYSNPETKITFPSTYNTTFSDVSAYDNKFNYMALYQGVWVDSVREKKNSTITSKIDGWGTVITPNASFPCLRQNIKTHAVDSTWAKVFVGNYHYWMLVSGDTSNTQSYSYISNSNGPIVDIQFYSDSSAISEVRWNTAYSYAVAQYNVEADMTIFPNPSFGTFELSLNAPAADDYVIELNNILGQNIYSETLQAFSGKYTKSFNVAAYGKGVYLVSIRSKDNQLLRKVIVY